MSVNWRCKNINRHMKRRKLPWTCILRFEILGVYLRRIEEIIKLNRKGKI